MGGDFIVVRFPSKRRNCQVSSASMRQFFEFIDDLRLKDIPSPWGAFTCTSGSNNGLACRLDSFLVLEDCENHFSGLFPSILPRPVSDHAPILLDGGGVRFGKFAFCFENMWLKVDGFKN